MTARACLICPAALTDAPSLKEGVCADCAMALDLLPASMPSDEKLAAVRAARSGS
jgi:hypothetical protein